MWFGNESLKKSECFKPLTCVLAMLGCSAAMAGPSLAMGLWQKNHSCGLFSIHNSESIYTDKFTAVNIKRVASAIRSMLHSGCAHVVSQGQPLESRQMCPSGTAGVCYSLLPSLFPSFLSFSPLFFLSFLMVLCTPELWVTPARTLFKGFMGQKE